MRAAVAALALACGCGTAAQDPCASVVCAPATECFIRGGVGVCTVACAGPGDTDPACDARTETCTCHLSAACPQCKACVLACAPKA